MKSSARTVVLVVLAVTVLGALGTVAVAAALWVGLEGLGGDLEWSPDEVPERSLPDAFGVRLPVAPVRYQSRVMGFQDLHLEVLAQLPPGAAEAFLQRNALTRGEPTPLDGEALELVRKLDPAAGALEGHALELPAATLPDGGVRNLHRSGVLVEGPAGAWVYLVAFET